MTTAEPPVLTGARPGVTPAGWYRVPGGRVLWWTGWGWVVPAAPEKKKGPPPLVAKGQFSEVLFDGEAVTIRRPRLVGRMTVGYGERRIPLDSIAAVHLTPAGPNTLGFIQFTVTTGDGSSDFAQEDLGKDDHAVMFYASTEPAFIAIRTLVENALRSGPAPTLPAQPDPPVQPDPPARAASPSAAAAPDTAQFPMEFAVHLRQLAELHAAGILTDEEFTSKKRDILARM